jgi:hypothetical protein
MSPLADWADFYVVTGTAAATLTGLMFVVVTLVAGRSERPSFDGAGVYSTPTVVHFGASLLIAIVLSAPWPDLWEASLPLGLLGLSGLVYGAVVARRARRQVQYRPVMEDWLCHVILPPVAYITILVAAVVLPQRPVPALFSVAAVVVLFLVIGLHNAWDIVTYLTFEQARANDEPES